MAESQYIKPDPMPETIDFLCETEFHNSELLTGSEAIVNVALSSVESPPVVKNDIKPTVDGPRKRMKNMKTTTDVESNLENEKQAMAANEIFFYPKQATVEVLFQNSEKMK